MVARAKSPSRGMVVFTTGEVARFCRVSPRTVQKWTNAGRLKCYRIPGSQDRRIEREHLIEFMKANDMPLGRLEEESRTQILLIATERLLPSYLRERLPESTYPIRTAADGFAAGCEFATFSPDVVVVDLCLGRGETVSIVRRLRTAADGGDCPLLVALMGDDTDEFDSLKAAGFDEVLQKPFNPDLLAARISQLREQV